MVEAWQHKYISIIKYFPNNTYPKEADTKVNAIEISIEYSQYKKKVSNFIKLPIYPRKIFEDWLAKGLVERIPRKELEDEEEKPRLCKPGIYYGYHQVKGHYTNSLLDINKLLKELIDKGIVEYKDGEMVNPLVNQDIHKSTSMVNMVIHEEEQESK